MNRFVTPNDGVNRSGKGETLSCLQKPFPDWLSPVSSNFWIGVSAASMTGITRRTKRLFFRNLCRKTSDVLRVNIRLPVGVMLSGGKQPSIITTSSVDSTHSTALVLPDMSAPFCGKLK